MDTSLNLPTFAVASTTTAPAGPKAMSSKVQPIESTEQGTTLPANKPFVAQVVSARLAGVEFPETQSEIAPPERTLRPYDVPMLPYDNTNDGETP